MTDFGMKGFAEVNSAIVVEKGQIVTAALKRGRVAGCLKVGIGVRIYVFLVTLRLIYFRPNE